MSRASIVALLLALPAGALGAEKFAVIAVGDPPNGPDGDITELTYQLRAACRDRVPNVLDPSDMRGRLVGRTSNANESELDRAYGGALVVYQNGEFDSALRTLRAIVGDLESLPETEESYFQWKRANLRLALSAMAAQDPREVENALGKVLRMEPGLQPDADQFSPGFRKRFEEVRAKVRALPKRKLTITAEGRQGTVYVNGKNMGTTPLTLPLPSGVYRVGGGAGTLRVPSLRVDLEQEDRAVVLDFALAESLRMNAGPGLALAPQSRANGVVRAGAWLGVDKLVVVSRVDEGQAQFLVGSIYDVLRGALLREGSVRMVAGGVPSVNLAALSAFLLTGQASREVKELSRDAPRRVPPPAVATTAEPLPPAKPATQPAEPGRVAAAPSTAPSASTAPQAPAAVAPPASTKPPAPLATASAPPPPIGSPAQTAVASMTSGPPSAPVKNPAAPVLVARGGSVGKPDLELHPATMPAKLSDLPSSDPGRRPAWKRPVAIGTGVLAVSLAAVALQQNSSASRAYSQSNDHIRADGGFNDQASRERYYSLRSDGDRARTNATIAAGAAAACAVTAAVLGWSAWRTPPDAGTGLKLQF